jgi:hypothetical protein
VRWASAHPGAHTGPVTYTATLAAAAAKVAASFGIPGADPVILADGANVIVHLRPAPVVAKVAASTTAVRPDPAAWLQRELDVAGFLAGRGIPVMTPSPEAPPVVHHGDGQVMSFWRYLSPSRERPGESVIGSMLRTCTPNSAAIPQLRRLHLTVWYNLYAERLPDLRPRAAELLTLWPAP